MRLARWAFRTAGVFGLIAMVPLLFAERWIEEIMPPAVNHAEFFYGFIILNICWQVLYLFVASDPIRFRPMMIPSFLAKASGPITLLWLLMLGRISSQWLPTTILDGAFAAMFLVSFWITGGESA